MYIVFFVFGSSRSLISAGTAGCLCSRLHALLSVAGSVLESRLSDSESPAFGLAPDHLLVPEDMRLRVVIRDIFGVPSWPVNALAFLLDFGA